MEWTSASSVSMLPQALHRSAFRAADCERRLPQLTVFSHDARTVVGQRACCHVSYVHTLPAVSIHRHRCSNPNQPPRVTQTKRWEVFPTAGYTLNKPFELLRSKMVPRGPRTHETPLSTSFSMPCCCSLGRGQRRLVVHIDHLSVIHDASRVDEPSTQPSWCASGKTEQTHDEFSPPDISPSTRHCD